jgi:hypothetical protein
MTASDKFRRYVRSVAYFSEQIDRLTDCYQVEKRTQVKWEDFPEEDRLQLREAAKLFREAKRIRSAVWARKLGEQIMREEGP